ncbi:hypothetical protein CVT24_007440 [Panaeolus cyanescens]|uniref:Uncharacterized protein n=1 Tax=Panaeolus cyanescens TaxID=181874 RepID=A0A409W4X6_9AGAR|nr:hypothetical protein CVT24_007440 [Panaeolus cyanescens]
MRGLTIFRPFLNKIKGVFVRKKVAKASDDIPIMIPANGTARGDGHTDTGTENKAYELAHPYADIDFDNLHLDQLKNPTGTPESSKSPASYTINNLPPEILGEIFLSYMFWDYDPDLLDPELEGMISVFIPNPRAAPLLFCGVCKYWRDVAISTPALWSAFCVNDAFTLETIGLWLQRSQDHPLSFVVSIGRDLSRTEQLARLMEMLYNIMPRWKQVSIHLPSAAEMRDLLFHLIPEEGQSQATQLAYLHLSTAHHQADHLDSESLSRLSSFPHATLKRFRWDEYDSHIPDFRHLSKSLWRNLKQIYFSTITTRVLLSFLKACENLRFVNVNILHTKANANVPTLTTPVLARNLQALNIATIEGNLRDSIFPLLETPKLKRLSFGQTSGRGHSVVLRDFLERSGCTLEALCIICATAAFNEPEVEIMFNSPVFMAIPHLSLRLAENACHPTFPQAIIAEAVGLRMKTVTARACYEPKNYMYHLGWGTLDIARSYYIDYPFLVKGVKPIAKWTVALTDGPLVSA